MTRIEILAQEEEEGTLERHTGWEPEGGSGVYRRGLLVWRNFTRKYERCETLIFLDGQNLFEEVANGRAHWGAWRRFADWETPLLIIAVPSSKHRYEEYVGWSEAPGHFSKSGDKHAFFATHHVVDYAREIHPRSRLRGLVGASAGGVAALYAGWRYPGRVPAIGCLSAGRHYFHELLSLFDGPPADRVYLSCADRGMDAGFREQNVEFARALRARGCKVRLRQHRGDHSESSWGRRLPDLMKFMLDS